MASLRITAPRAICLPKVSGKPNGVEAVSGCPKGGSEAFTDGQVKTCDWRAADQAMGYGCAVNISYLHNGDTLFSTIDCKLTVRT
jgi:hypothetical protein